MNIPDVQTTNKWIAANQRYLQAALDLVRTYVECSIASGEISAETTGFTSDFSAEGADKPHAQEREQRIGAAQQALQEAASAMPQPPAIETLCNTFGLSPFERDILLLCAGIEFTSTFAPLCAAAQGDATKVYPTFSLALAAFPQAHWSALTPDAPLRHWRLIEVGAGGVLTSNPLRIDERILHYLAGVQHLDERLLSLVQLVQSAEPLPPSHQAVAEPMAHLWTQALSSAAFPIVQLCGNEQTSKQSIAAAACKALGLSVYSMSAHTLPTSASERSALLRLWEREFVLSGCALLLDYDELDAADTVYANTVRQFIEALHSPVVLASRERWSFSRRASIALDVYKPTMQEQRSAWHQALGSLAPQLNGRLEGLISQFSFNPSTLFSVVGTDLSRPSHGRDKSVPTTENLAISVPAENGATTDEVSTALWDICRQQTRPRLEGLAQRIEPIATWDDLVLPQPQLQMLHEIAVHIRQRAKVYETWGFARRSARGLGISALFSGVSGTGKTLAAEVLAHELRLDLYHIDLSSIVSKYIGETEKNLRRVFDAAEAGGAILLFDEADALFGKRSEVKDSHDRYANIEVSYLLQRMEAYRGLAILTTNMKNALDAAFLRRIRFIVQFPFPDVTQRAEIWQRIFPASTPTQVLSIDRLARLNIAGGTIRNIALNAAFLAADADEPVRMKHLAQAARSEYAKLEKPLTEAEIGGWL